MSVTGPPSQNINDLTPVKGGGRVFLTHKATHTHTHTLGCYGTCNLSTISHQNQGDTPQCDCLNEVDVPTRRVKHAYTRLYVYFTYTLFVGGDAVDTEGSLRLFISRRLSTSSPQGDTFYITNLR